MDLGSLTAVASVRARHKRAGVVRQLARGLYDYPIEHSKLGRVAPPADAVARAIARREIVLKRTTPRNRLRVTLRGVALFDRKRRTTEYKAADSGLRLESEPFPVRGYKRIAVKVVDVYRKESTVVREI